jgi:Domain of unknown function (DUF4194)
LTSLSPTESAKTELSVALIHLMKGPVYRDTHERAWHSLLSLRREVADFVAMLGLETVIDEAEGYAFLRSRPTDEDPEVPRLVARRTLPFHTSLLLALLRKRLADLDASSAETRLVLTREQIVEMLRLYLPDSTNETKVVDSIDPHITRILEMGFLRKMRGSDDAFEVRRIIKAFVDGQWLADFDRRLDEYLALLAGRDPEDAEPEHRAVEAKDGVA